MIGWLHPAALAGLSALAGPILVHLLRRQRAERIPFPSLRFLQPTRTAAVRLRLPSDVTLLAVRLAIIALAVCALAQPILLTDARRRAWEARTSRVIVVDTSRSMAGEQVTAREAAAAEAGDSRAASTIETEDPGRGIRHAVAQLDAMPPGRREIVVISDFQQGTIDSTAVAAVPAHVGLRFLSVGKPADVATFAGDALLGAAGIDGRQQTVTLTAMSTVVAIRTISSQTPGLRVLAHDADRQQVDGLLRAVARAGTPAPTTQAPLAIAFPKGESPGTVQRIAGGWMLQAIVAMRGDGALAAAASADRSAAGHAADPWVVVARDAVRLPLVSAAAAGPELVIRIDASPSAFVSAATVRAALFAAYRGEGRERDVARIPPAQLAAWARGPGAPPPDQWRHAPPGDARYGWAAALVLLLVEATVRRRRRAAVEVPARAA